LVAVFEDAVGLGVLLNSVVREMHILIIGVVGVDGELRRRRSEVAFGEEVEGGVIVDEDPDSDVELPLVYQERLLDVLLQDERVVLYLILPLLLLLRLLRLCGLLLLGGCLLIVQSTPSFFLTLVERWESGRGLGCR
jgi:hypothetical protein